MKMISIDLKFDMVSIKKEYSLCLYLEELGTELTTDCLKSILDKYKNFITCVFFCGEAWSEKDLIANMQTVKLYFKKVGLHTKINVSKNIQDLLDYLELDLIENNRTIVAQNKNSLTDSELIKLYTIDKLDVKTIAKKYERDVSTIYRRLKKIGI